MLIVIMIASNTYSVLSMPDAAPETFTCINYYNSLKSYEVGT